MALPLLLGPAIIGAMSVAIGSLAWRVVIALGIGVVSYTGVTSMVDTMRGSVISNMSGIGGDVIGLIAYLWIDKGLTVIFSAVTILLSMRILTGTLKKFVLK